MATIHACGGIILSGNLGTSEAHDYCAQCGAYAYHDDGGAMPVPNGTDRAANDRAWNAGEARSPDA